jgi:hypothetical protein
MINVHAKFLTVDQIRDILTPVLQSDFGRFGYRGSEIKEDETFDGMPVVRVTVDVERPVPAPEWTMTLVRLHDLLRARNDERFVFLSAPGPSEDTPPGDEDVD